jgi:glucokinase
MQGRVEALQSEGTDIGRSTNGFVVGVDVGGTKVAAGLVDTSGEIKRHIKIPMSAKGEAADGFAAVVSAVDLVLEDPEVKRSLSGIGICSPGPLDPKTGVIINPPNLPCWRNYPLAAEVSRIYRVPVKVDNDANAAALAETLWGAGRGHRNVFFTIVGTGIGTGIVFDGQIYHGRTGAAGEGGHMSIDYRGPRCGCGKPGCIEALAAGPAIARRARAKVADDPSRGSSILRLAGGNIDHVTSEKVGQAYTAGDALAKEILQETVELLTVWLGNIVDLLDPDVVIMGGGVSSMLRPFFEEIRERLPGCCINPRCQEIPLLPARYGADAGVAGGAALCAKTSVGV